MSISIALIGDYNKKVDAHVAIPRAFELVSSALQQDLRCSWVETTFINKASELSVFDAIWVVPGSLYKNMDGALTAIRFARETKTPFFGTCGGFQHALIEFARNVCGIGEADHAETSSKKTELVVSRLQCSLAGKTGRIVFLPGSQLFKIFQGREAKEEYQCNYGLNHEWKSHLEAGGMNFTGLDLENQVRAFELPVHPFFIGTLFQPELSALRDEQHPLITAFVSAALKKRSRNEKGTR